MLIIGHRGAPAHVPENTISSFRKAMEMNADMIELDISLCRSGELVVIHDERIDRTTNGKGYVWSYTLEELKKFDIEPGEKIPTLEEVMNLIDGKTSLNIELKGKETAEALERFLKQYLPGSKWKPENILVSSFDLLELSKFRKLMPELRIGALYGGVPLGFSDFASPLAPWSIHYNLDYIREEMVAHAHDCGYQVYVYTVDLPEDMERVRAMGVDGVFSNDPQRRQSA